MSTGAQVIVSELERAGVEVCFGLPGRAQPRAVGGAARVLDPARRRPPRAGRGVRGGRLRARDRAARRRADHDRPGRGEHARRGRRGVGVALADPRDRHRHPVGAAARRASTAASCTRPTASPRCSRRWSRPCTSRLPPTTVAQRRGRARSRDAGHRARRGPVYLEIATDLLARRGRPAARRRAARARRSRRRPDLARGEPRALDAAERPLIWAGGGARDAGDAVARARRAPRGARPHHLRRGGHPAARPPVPGRPPAARRGRRARCGTRPTSCIAIGSDLDGVQTQNFAQPQPDTLIAVVARAARQLPRRRPRSTATPASVTAALADGVRDRGGLDALAERLRRGARRGLRQRSTPPRCASSTRSASPSPPTASSSSTCASRATGSPASTRPPRRAGCRSRSAGERSATPSRPRSAPRWPARRPGRLDLRRRRLPVRLRRARHDGPGADPADRRDRRRRRLRDAPLRPGARRRRDLRRRPAHPRLRRPRRLLRRPARRPSTASTTRSARRSPATSRTRRPSVLVARTPDAPRPAAQHLPELVPPPNLKRTVPLVVRGARRRRSR